MNTEWMILPDELFFLGELMNAKYIDYKYIASMPDIQKNYLYHKSRVLAELEDKGMIEEDFSGNIEIDEELKEVLEPIFFGKVECRLKLDRIYGNLHVMNNDFTFVRNPDGNMTLSSVSENDLRKMVYGRQIELNCTNIEKGYYSVSFTSDEMKNADNINKSIMIMKGEWDNGQ